MMMKEGQFRKISVKVGDSAHIYRGEIIKISDDGFCIIKDYKTGEVRIKLSEIITEEAWDGGKVR